MELAVIILNWNAAADTLRCVRSFDSWTRVRPTIWVVDNASADGSAEALVQQCPHIHLVQSLTNLGFAGGNNLGLKAALDQTQAPILLLNNDAFLEETAAVRLLETLQENPRIGFIGPLLFDAMDKERLLAAGGRNPVEHHHSHIDRLPSDEPVQEVEYVPGTAIIGRSETFRQVGLLDERYFFNMEVADLCMRAGQQGYRSTIDMRARAYHNLHRSSPIRETLYTYYIIRNRFLLIHKFYRWPQRIWLYSLWGCYSLALLLKLQLAGRTASSRAVGLGLLDGLQRRFGGQNERILRLSPGATDSHTLPSPGL